MTKYLDLLGLTTYDLAIKLYIDNSTPESITTEEIEELFNDGGSLVTKNPWNYSYYNNAIVGSFLGLTNPFVSVIKDNSVSKNNLSIVNTPDNKYWCLGENNTPVVVNATVNRDELYTAIVDHLKEHYSFDFDDEFHFGGIDEVDNAPTGFNIV